MNIQLIRHSKRKLQRLPELRVFPLAASASVSAGPPDKPFVTFTVESRKHKQPTAIPWTGSVAAVVTNVLVTEQVKHRRGTKYRLQGVELDQFTLTQAGFFDGFWPGSARVQSKRSGFKRQIQKTVLDEYPTTVPTPALGAYLEKKAHKWFEIAAHLQLTNSLKVYEETPPPPENLTRLGLAPAFTVYVQESRKLQKLSHVPYTPATTIFEATIPSGFFNYRKRWKAHRKIQQVINLPDTPATPAPELVSGYPGSAGVKAFRSAFKLTLQSAAYPDAYPQTPAGSIEPFAGYAIIPKAHKWLEIAAYLQLTNSLTVYKKTDPNYYSGWALAFASTVKANRTSFERRHLRLVDAIDAKTPPAITELVPSWQLPKQHNRRGKVHLQELPRLHTFPRLEPANEATVPPETIRRRETARILQFPAELNTYPEKPAPPSPDFIAAVINLALRRKAAKRKRVIQPEPTEPLWSPPLQPEPCRFNVSAEINTFAVAVEIDEFSVPQENDIFFVELECDIFALDECGESSIIVCPTGPSVIMPTAQGYPSYKAPKAHRFGFDQIVSRRKHVQRKPTDELTHTPTTPEPLVVMSEYFLEHDNGGFSDAVCTWDFKNDGEFSWREGASGGFTIVPDEWFVGHPDLTISGDYELGLKSSVVVAGTGEGPLYFQGSPMSVGDWRTFNSTAIHRVRKTSLFGFGTYIVDTVYQIRLIAEPGNILEEFTIRATCIRS